MAMSDLTSNMDYLIVLYLIFFKVALKSDDSSKKQKAQEKNDVVETSTAPPKKMSSSTINTKEIISQRNMEKNHLPPGRITTRLNRTDTHRLDLKTYPLSIKIYCNM